MVKISFIKTTVCPICGCSTVVSESVEVFQGRVREHCSGGRWEHRKFACGYHVQYCPNFFKELVLGKCSADPEEAVREEKRKALKNLIISQINSGDCQEDYKERLLNAIQYV